ncbi:hypothetical protein ACQYAD_16620 [Neobacillus sp. SM06]|uniref:hypothetical protein n=1 Tax=Neobacillus sp. SM06 TaxID=3422492 RepID=UPI003D290F09
MKKYKYFIAIGLLISIVFVSIKVKTDPVQETITYFPIDPTVSFQSASTSLSQFIPLKKRTYSYVWQTKSTLDRNAYLRQDVGLLFSNGRLIGKLGKWKTNTEQIIQQKKMVGSESALLQALTFHYAEIHHNEAEIFSAQTMTSAATYVVNSPFESLFTFQQAGNEAESKWKNILDDKTSEVLQSSWKKGLRTFSIQLNHYNAYPLTQLYTRETLPGFSKEETERVVGNLWEGLYKNYFLGIKKADGTIVPPDGSTIPLILIAKDRTKLLVLTETEKGEPILLRQMIAYGH